jgi:membrane protein DedA with SNARE-associated domain
MVKEWLTVYLQSVGQGGFGVIVWLMALESSVIPLPSEVVIPPAAFMAATQHTMELWQVVLAGTIGSWIGASLMYAVCRFWGRAWLLRIGTWVGVTQAKLESTERWVARTGSTAVFIARLLPVVRHLIGIPMGLTRMSFMRYSLMTLLGSALWCSVLAWVGVKAGQDPLVVAGDVRHISLWFGLGGLMVLVLYFVFVHRSFKKLSPP